jgi:hypothetical protein
VPDLTFHYALTGIGWAKARFSSGQRDLAMSLSYLGRGLTEITECFVELVRDATGEPPDPYPRYEFLWLGEPWGYLVVAEADTLGDSVRIRVWRYDSVLDRRGHPRPEEGELAFDATGAFVSFVASIVRESLRILQGYGFVGYRHEWHGEEFPASDVIQLRHYVERVRAGGEGTSATREQLTLSREIALLTREATEPQGE